MIKREVADKLSMATFGEYSLAGVMEQCKSRTRQCHSLSLGPLTMEKPLWMEMEIDNLVSGGPGETIGIIGQATIPLTVLCKAMFHIHQDTKAAFLILLSP